MTKAAELSVVLSFMVAVSEVKDIEQRHISADEVLVRALLVLMKQTRHEVTVRHIIDAYTLIDKVYARSRQVI